MELPAFEVPIKYIYPVPLNVALPEVATFEKEITPLPEVMNVAFPAVELPENTTPASGSVLLVMNVALPAVELS